MNELVQKLAPSAFQPPSDALNPKKCVLLDSETITVPFQNFNELEEEFDLNPLTAV